MSEDVLFQLGWDPRFVVEEAGATLGRVVRVDRDRVTVVTAAGGDVVAYARELPAVGDWVGVAGERVVSVLPRAGALMRRDPGRPVAQVIAANVDVVLVVVALDPKANLRRLERTLAMAWESGATPVVVLTKPDRCPDVAREVAAVRAVALAVDVFVVSGLTGEGVDELRPLLAPNRTAVLVGASGAGKSTLTNLLLGEEVLETGEVRADDRRGRHTTSARHVVVLPAGGVLIDTPGLRGLVFWEAEEGLAATFADIDELAAGCRFRDCRHQAEPGCAVVGRVDRDRLRNWRHLSGGIDPLEARRRARILGKSSRQRPSPKR